MAKNKKKASAKQIANSSKSTAQLELPEGYTKPTKTTSTSKKTKRRGKSVTMSDLTGHSNAQALVNAQAAGAYPSPPSTPPSRGTAANIMGGIVLEPWVLDPTNYEAPSNDDRLLSFNYNRKWVSLGMKSEDEIKREIQRGKLIKLPTIFPDHKDTELDDLLKKYKAAGQYNRSVAISKRWHHLNVPWDDKERKTRLTTRAYDLPCPFKLWGWHTGSPTNEMKQSGEELSLSGLFNKPELGMRILTHLTPSVRDISALALTSKGFSEQVSRLVEFWDIGGDAKDFEVDVASKAANFKFQEDQSGNIIQSGLGIRSGILVITRLTEQDPDPTFKPHYRESFLTSRNLLKTIHDIPNSFKHVVFDQLQYFDTRVFKMLVASLPNLETVSISRCELMDVMKLPKLIEIIKSAGIKRLSQSDATHVEAPADNASDESSTRPGSFGTRAWQEALTNSRASGKKEVKDYIKLDFAPYYFSGPDTKNRLGSFGVTHHQPTFHTPKAVTGLTLMCNADAEEIGMDLWSDSSSYFSFVKRLPGPDRLWATKAREAVMTLKQQTTQDRWIDQAYATRARDQFADDMMAAVSGDNFYPNQVSLSRWKWLCADHHKWGWWRESKRCGDCKYDHLRAFFDLKAGQCWACHMLEFVNDIDDSHARRYQHNTLEIYLRRKRDYENADTLKEFFNHPEYDKWFRRALKSTGLADKAWSYFQFEAEFHDPSGMVAMEPVLPAQPPWYPRSGTAGITVRALAMAHWMWARNEVTQHYDIRKGGPQCRHPCYVAAIYASAAAGGAQGMGTYSQNWTWSPLSRDVWTEHLRTWMHWEDLNPEQRKLGIDGAIKQQIDQLREAWRNGEFPPHIREILVKLEYPIIAEDEIREFIEYKNRIEDCGIGLMTPYQQPFDHDHPFLNQDLDPDFHQKPAEDKLPYRAANRWGVW